MARNIYIGVYETLDIAEKRVYTFSKDDLMRLYRDLYDIDYKHFRIKEYLTEQDPLKAYISYIENRTFSNELFL